MLEILKIILPILLGLSAFQLGIKYIFSSHYRLKLNKIKFKEKQKGVEELYQIYKKHIESTESLPPFVLDAKISSCLGTDRYDYRLLFLLIKGNFASIEDAAKRVIDAWPFIDITYPDGNIKLVSFFSMRIIKFWRKIILGTYLLLSIFLMVLIGGHQLFGSWLFLTAVATGTTMYLCIWIGSRLSTVLSVERILTPNE